MALVDAVQAGSIRQQSRAFFSPVFDFLCLGGGSLLLLPILIWVIPDNLNARALGFAILLANVINNPHFAYSYQIFYRTFRAIVADFPSNTYCLCEIVFCLLEQNTTPIFLFDLILQVLGD